jgi:hypothetical protein
MLHSSILQKKHFKLLPGYRRSDKRTLRIFGPKRKKLTEEGRKSNSEELNNLYSSPKYY